MAVLIPLASQSVGVAWGVSRAAAAFVACSTAVTAGVLAGTAHAGASATRKVTTSTGSALSGGARTAATAAKKGVRLTGRALTGSVPIPDNDLRRIQDLARAMFEPPQARRRRRVWSRQGRAHVELAAPVLHGGHEVHSALRHTLERLDGVEWATVNGAVGRVQVAFDDRRIGLDDIVAAVADFEQARGGRHVFPQQEGHPGDVEPLVAAIVMLIMDSAAVGVALAGRVVPVPKLTRHATVVLALLDSQPWIKRALIGRFGTTGTDLLFAGTGSLLHAATQSPTVPALFAVSAVQRVLEVSARRAVWQRREPELCLPEPDAWFTEPIATPRERPTPLPSGPIESYRNRLGPTALVGAAGLLMFTLQPGRSADLLKALTPRAAVMGREAFAAVLDLRMCRRGVLPMDGSAYRRLDRIDAVVVDSGVLCDGPPVVIAATAEADGWDDRRVRAAAIRLLDPGDTNRDRAAGGPENLKLSPVEEPDDGSGRRALRLLQADKPVGTVTVSTVLDPLAEALIAAIGGAGHRLVLTEHVGIAELTDRADQIAAAGEPLADTVRRLQADGHGVLAVSAVDSPGLIAADVGVAVPRPRQSPAWGADLMTTPGLADTWRLITATNTARSVSRRVTATALTANTLGGLLAIVGAPTGSQRMATTPGKIATVLTLTLGTFSALRHNAAPSPPTI